MENTELNAHAAPPKLVRRKCCPGGAKFYLEPPDIDESIAYRLKGERPEPAGVAEDTPPTEQTAWHESGHAIFGHAFGMPIDFIRVCKPAMVKFKRGNNLSAPMRIAVDFAGAIGEMSRLRCWSTISPHDEDDYLNRIEAGSGGGCDECKMAGWAWMAVGLSAGKSAAQEVFRNGQRLALDIGQRRDVQLAIRALATALMEIHTMTGGEAHEIIEKYIKFGELKNAQENKEDA